jgi:type II secretory pathway pseudopilin PulG
MEGVVMNKRARKGASLIEVLVVMVVFLVGILGIIQIFPTGLGILRTTRSNTVANAIARAEVQRIQGAQEQVAEYIAAVTYGAGTSVIIINPQHRFDQLMPAGDTGTGTGHINATGNVVRDATVIGSWPKVSGANQVTRVIGEGKKISAPRMINGVFASLMQLQFAPIYYLPDPGTGISDENILTVYGNDLRQRWGNADNLQPNPFQPSRDYEYYFIDESDATDNTPVLNKDQVWLGMARVGGTPVLAKYRFACSFLYNNGTSIDNYDVIVRINIDPAAPPTGVTAVGSYWVIDLSELVGYTNPYNGSSSFVPANVITVDPYSVRVERVFDELAPATPFSNGNPYQYKVGSGQLGSIVLNPAGFDTKVYTTGGRQDSLTARADYTVYDWRIIRDEFRVPSGNTRTIKLALQGLKVASRKGADMTTPNGLNMQMPNYIGTPGNLDFVLQDVDTGGVITGGPDKIAGSSYAVDYSGGAISFRDTDAGTPGLQGRISYLDNTGAWTAPVDVNIEGRNVRALYMANGEWSVQVHKAANSYRQTLGIGAGLSIAEYYVGGTWDPGSGPVGATNRIYFPLSDLGHRVVIREIWYIQGGSLRSLNDQELFINGVENIGGIDHAYAEITPKTGPGAVFDLSGDRFPVRGVRGASLRVRVLWNPETFRLGNVDTDNYDNLEKWMQSTRRIQTETFLTKRGQN